jgi:hypothetical protein
VAIRPRQITAEGGTTRRAAKTAAGRMTIARKGASMGLRGALARIVMAALLAGSLVAAMPGPARAGTELTPRSCHTILSGDQVRRLDVCARGWVTVPDYLYTRGVVEMHTYKLLGGINDWVDSTSQTITLEWADNHRDGTEVAIWGGSDNNCRVNGPGGRVACSVPNTYRVAFYGPQLLASNVNTWDTAVFVVSWRDDRGVPHAMHKIDVDPNHSGYQQLYSPPWSA